ncbi:hypothetical protein B0T25DRAFT_546441 [Lasiosphaeria hispida]|uniref:Uncharacterized protein n=1 Tax=Lasiosphaeria hispida TaxID=260671 RepID=A0AAJ0HDZ4_9PEZI|nr:hypothetical protein B0T25DRAFT_546441 [Lasiosphaeria hispida]
MGQHRWRAVGRILERRKRAGKRSDVYVRGVIVSQDKVQREVSRHVALTLRSKFPMGPDPTSPSPEPPDGVVICSPVPSHTDVALDYGSPWTQFLGSLARSGAYGFVVGTTAVHGKRVDSALPQAHTSVLTQWPCLGLVGSLDRHVGGESGRRAALLEAQNTAWVTEALGRTMPEEYPGQHALTARDISGNWKSQAGLAVRLFLLANNFFLSDRRFRCELHDEQVSALVEQVMAAGSKDLESFLRAPGLVSEAIKAEVFSWALRCGRDDIVRLLLSLGCDLEPENTYARRWRRPQSLQVAAYIRDKRTSARMIRTLLEHGAKVDNSLVHSALNIAIATGNQEAIDLLMEAGACLRLPSLAAAIRAGNDEMVRRVLDTGVVDINTDIPPAPMLWGFYEWAALAHAANRGHLHIVKTLLARGADAAAVHEWSEFGSVHYSDEAGIKLRTTALGIAVAAEQVETAQFLAQHTRKGVEKPSPGGGYVCPLAIACLVGNREIIKALLDAGAGDVSRADSLPENLSFRTEWWSRGFPLPKTLLDLLIIQLKGTEEQLVELCEMLIHRGARTDRALIMAVIGERVEVARLLLHYGVSPDTSLPETKASAFGLAIEMGNLGLARILHQAGATETGSLDNVKGVEMAEFLSRVGLLDVILRERGWLILTQAIRGEGESRWLVNRILEAELDLTGKYTSVLVAAVEHHDTLDAGFIKAMIDHGAAWTIVNLDPAIETAIKLDAPDDVMDSLLAAYMRVEKSASPYQWKSELTVHLLFCVARHGSSRMLDAILKAFDWESGDLGAALNHAIWDANYRVIQGLLDAGASLRGDLFLFGSPLKSAVMGEQVWLVKLLLSSGADVQDHGVLASAISLGHTSLVEILLDAGASPNGPTGVGNGMTALQIASHMGFLGMARKLIDAGADVNARGKVCDDATLECYGLEYTALTLAASEGRLETLHLLLSRGAAVHGLAGRRQYIDAVQAAAMNYHGAAAALLKSYGGWAASDERALRAKHAAAIVAMKAEQNTSSGWVYRYSSETPTGSAVTVESSPQDGRDNTAASTELLDELACAEMPGWPQDWAEEVDTGGAAVHSEFHHFFFEELSRLQDYAAEDEGWSVGCPLGGPY